MKFKHRSGWVSGKVAISLRTRAPVNESSEFEVPGDYAEDPEVLQRLVDAGHEPVNFEELPDGVEYDAAEAEEAEAENDGNEEAEESGGDEPPGELTEMSRSDLWELVHSDEFEAEPEFSWNESTAEKLLEWIRERRTEAE
jgi:hypothetical protein